MREAGQRAAQHEEFSERLRTALLTQAKRCQRLEVSKRDCLYTAGQRDENFYLICQGWVKTMAITRCGKTCLLDIHASPEVIGESCLVSSVRDATAMAMAHTVAIRIPRATFLAVLAASEAYEESLRFLAGRLTEQQQRITQLVTTNCEQRLAATLMQLSVKLGRGRSDHRTITQPITQAELSEIVGTTRSRIGHFLQEFRRMGVVCSDTGTTLVIDESRLCAYFEARP